MDSKSCEVCNFGVWNPVIDLTRSRVGIYNDARFRGRCIVTLDTHFENLEDVDEATTAAFMADIKSTVRAIKNATGSERVNVAILGNAEPHVHAHLIPRYPAEEQFPNSSPWNDQRPRTVLSEDDMTILTASLRSAFNAG